MKQNTLANLTFQNITVRGDRGQSPASVLFDTGASISFISLALARKIASIVPADQPFDITLADGSRVAIDTMVMASVDLGGK